MTTNWWANEIIFGSQKLIASAHKNPPILISYTNRAGAFGLTQICLCGLCGPQPRASQIAYCLNVIGRIFREFKRHQKFHGGRQMNFIEIELLFCLVFVLSLRQANGKLDYGWHFGGRIPSKWVYKRCAYFWLTDCQYCLVNLLLPGSAWTREPNSRIASIKVWLRYVELVVIWGNGRY